ncbi:peptidoglycan bridge formation glycyltransferase FemA/FemB family protein, partial [bacterium]|nr:peptidoglycan bridge formation glycyltransferase FemA/FemB family protein [bacterium]
MNIFQHPLWIKTLEETYNYKTHKIKMGNSSFPIMEVGKPFSGKLVSLPFSDFVLNDEKLDFTKLDKSKKYQFRGGVFDEDFVSEKFLVHEISLLESEDEIFKRFEGKTRRNVKKAEAENLKFRISSEFNELKLFMGHNYHTRRKHGIPPQPDSFFEKLYKNLFKENLGAVVIISQNEVAVSSSVVLFFEDTVYYKYGASNLDFLHLRPNDFMFWELIKWSKNKNFKKINLGKTEIDAEGLIRFKR